MKISPINYGIYKAAPLNFTAHHSQNVQDFNNPLGALCHTSVFFRYPDTDEKAAEILKETFPNKKLNIVSQGCSEGEEVYSLAMMCENKGIDADITGVDIDKNTVNKAKKGAYELDLEEYYYFISEKGSVNAIFCRNILYHLFYSNNKSHNQKVCNEAISKLKDNLCDNGLIMFAPHEPSGYDDVIHKALVKHGFKCLEEKQETIWQKCK